MATRDPFLDLVSLPQPARLLPHEKAMLAHDGYLASAPSAHIADIRASESRLELERAALRRLQAQPAPIPATLLAAPPLKTNPCHSLQAAIDQLVAEMVADGRVRWDSEVECYVKPTRKGVTRTWRFPSERD